MRVENRFWQRKISWRAREVWIKREKKREKRRKIREKERKTLEKNERERADRKKLSPRFEWAWKSDESWGSQGSYPFFPHSWLIWFSSASPRGSTAMSLLAYSYSRLYPLPPLIPFYPNLFSQTLSSLSLSNLESCSIKFIPS